MAESEEKEKGKEEKSSTGTVGMVPVTVAFAVAVLLHFACFRSIAGLSPAVLEGITVLYLVPVVFMSLASGFVGALSGTGVAAVLMVVVTMAGKPDSHNFGQVFTASHYVQILIFFVTSATLSFLVARQNKGYEAELEDRDNELRKMQVLTDKGKLADEELRHERERFKKMSSRVVAIQTLTQVIGKSLEEMKVLNEILNVSRKVFGAEQIAIFVLDERTKSLSVKAQQGLKEDEAKALRVRLGEGIIGYVVQNNEQVSKNDIKSDYKLSDLSKKSKIPSVMCAPLASGDKVVGAVNIMKLEGSRDPNQEDSRMLSLLATLAAMSMDNARLHQETVRLANVDGMTKLYNNRYFQGWLEKEMKSADQAKNRLSIFMTDIDHFKPFNDTYGHQIGDFVLEKTAQIITENIRGQDLAARYGGEEFVVVMPDTDTREAFMQAEKIRQAVANKTYKHGELSLNVTMSFGIATYPTHTRDKTELIKYADEGLYFAKQGGRNCTKVAFEEKQKGSAKSPIGPAKTPMPEVAEAPPPPKAAPVAPKKTRKYIKKIIKTKDGKIKQIVKVPVDESGKPTGPPVPVSVKPSSGDEVIN